MLYILRFKYPLGNDQHQAWYYIGYCADCRYEERIAEHRAGRGAHMTKHAVKCLIPFEVVLTLPGTTDDEKRLKRQHNTARIVERYYRGTLEYQSLSYPGFQLPRDNSRRHEWPGYQPERVETAALVRAA